MELYTKSDVLDLAGRTSYDRGVDYIDRIADLAFDGGRVTAIVEGTDEYEVNLRVDGGLDGQCDCPYGEEGNFCKHCVAVALVYLYHAEHGTLATVVGEPGESGDLAGYLTALDHSELVDLLLEAADRDSAVGQWLALRAAAGAGRPPDLGAATGRIDDLLTVEDYVGYEVAGAYASRVYDVTAWLADLHQMDRGPAVLPLVRHALRRLGEAFSSIDDSSGQVGGAAQQLAELHAQLCAETRPDPNELATWLVEFQTAGFDWPSLELADYADALGEDGLATYGEQVTARWRDWLAAGEAYGGYVIVYLMERWAEQRGDVDLLVAVLSTNRPHGVAYRRIAEALTSAGRHAEALDWAERGIADSGVRMDEALVEFVAARYAEAGRLADVSTLRRQHFQRSRSVATYRALREAALAVNDWPDTRRWALDLLHPTTTAPRAAPARYAGNLLVDVLLWEGAAEESWAAAQRHGATDPQWLRLAETRAATHPRDAISVYQKLIERQVELRNNQSYAQAADLAVRVKTLYGRLDEPNAAEQAHAFLAGLRASHKPKRNFMAELNRRNL